MSKDVSMKRHAKTIPTYVPKKAHELPMFFENKPYQGASGKIYPIPYSDGITDEKKDVDYDAFTLENEYIKTVVLPELGGKILQGYDKVGEYDFIYHNEVVKPALVGIAGPWISGGIEFNWPQHHRPTTYMPLEAYGEENADGGKTVWVGEVDPLNRMKGMAGITVDPGRSYIKAKVRVYNRTSQPRPFMWWANLAVPVNKDYKTVFPPDCEWVNDHDRRATLSWPIAKGVYKTARPYDFGEGTDISMYDAVKVPSSYLISQGQSDMDFIAGYDLGINKGIATVANHHISPGKKMWHWGKGDFGDMWCSNLTDENGPYIELMTGVYTDNQPDFTWIAPYETREFEQYWYPVRDIGDVKCATIDAAMNMEYQNGELFFGLNVTGIFENATVTVSTNGKTIFEETLTMTPDKSYLKTLPMSEADFNETTITLKDENGKELVSYKPYKRGQKDPIDVREPVKRPCEIDSVEELYINGYHLEQYKQHNYKAEDYYLEGLSRDENDIRCNTSMARLSFNKGEFEKTVEYADRAIKRLTMRNQHPTDTEAMYLKGMALKHLGKNKEAYDELYKSAWNYTHRSCAHFQLANLDIAAGEYVAAIEKLDISIGLNKGHTVAQNLKTAVMRKLDMEKAKEMALLNLKDDVLDFFAIIEASHFVDMSKQISYFAQKPENVIDVVADYINAGLFEDAIYTLDIAGSDYPLHHYYRAYCLEKLGKDGSESLKAAEALDTGYCFPSRIDDVVVLESAIKNNSGANAYYYLGCFMYHNERYDEAISMFENCIAIDTKHAKAYRNLSLLYFDKKEDFLGAKVCIEKAIEYRPHDPRLLLEYEQLLKNMNFSIDERLAVYDKYPELLAERDDCYLDRITLFSMKGEYQKAIDLAKDKRFHIYEGGEGKLTKQHAWMHVLYAVELMEKGEIAKAEKILMDGINMPKTYGEAKTFFNQEAHIYYYKGLITGNIKDFEDAAVYKAAISEISLFRALALRKLNKFTEAKAVLDEMIDSADNTIENCDMRTYYGVGSPSPMPYELDVVKMNLTNGYILKAYALLGCGKYNEADEHINVAREIDPYDFRIYAYDQIAETVKR